MTARSPEQDNITASSIMIPVACEIQETRIARQNPEKLDGLRRHLWKVKEGEEDLEKLKEDTLSIEEYVRRFEERTKDDPLRESYKALRDIFLKVNFLPHEIPKEGFAMAILEKGSVCLLSFGQLRKRGFILREPEKGA